MVFVEICCYYVAKPYLQHSKFLKTNFVICFVQNTLLFSVEFSPDTYSIIMV